MSNDQGFWYTVKPGDSIQKIAAKYERDPEKIWLDPKNKSSRSEVEQPQGYNMKNSDNLEDIPYQLSLHEWGIISDEKRKKSGKKYWRKVKRRVYKNGNYIEYNFGTHGFCRGIILYVDESIWIPPKEDQQANTNDDPDRTLHKFDDDKMKFVPDYGKKYKVEIPCMTILIDLDDDEFSDDDKYTLHGYEEGKEDVLLYDETLTIKDDGEKDGTKPCKLKFIGTPKNLKYTLEVETKLDDEVGTVVKYPIIENISYDENFNL